MRSRPAFAGGRTLDGRRPAPEDGPAFASRSTIRIDTPQEVLYYQHGGILQYVLRQLLWGRQKARAIGRDPCPTPDPQAQRR